MKNGFDVNELKKLKLVSIPPLSMIESWCKEEGIDSTHAKEIKENLKNVRKHPAFLRQLKIEKNLGGKKIE